GCSVGQIFIKDWNAEYIPEGCPRSSHVQVTFPASKKNKKPIKMIWTDGGIRPFHPDLIPADDSIEETGSGNGVMMIGSKGIMTCGTYGLEPKVYKKNGDVLTMPKDYQTSNKNEKLAEYGHQVS